MSMAKVSVVIPVYNVEDYLETCLDSVAGQTLRDIEIICIDDASPDGCAALLDAYAEKDPRIRVVHLTENRRQGYGRNRGMDLARGKYIYFLDADDMIRPETLEELCRTADADGLDGVFFNSELLCEDPSLEKYAATYLAAWKGSYPHDVTAGQTLFEAFIGQEEWTCYVQRQFWRLDFLREERIRFPDDVEHEDELFAFEAILLAKRVRYLRRPYFIRRYREHSVMTTPPTAKNFHGYFMNFVFMEEFLAERGICSTAAKRNIARIYERMTRYYGILSGKEDMTAWFRPGEMELYRFFEASQYADLHYSSLPAGLEEELRPYSSVYIYGAGAVARLAYRKLALHAFPVMGFVVTCRENDPPVLEGHRVFGADELDPDPDAVMLIAMNRQYEAEVRPALEAAGWHVVSFRK